MTHHTISEPNITILDRLTQRVDETIVQCRRFEKMANVADTWTHRWPTSTLKYWLKADDISRLDREAVLVALALNGTAEAGEILRSYDPAVYDHELFYEIVCFEWEQRFREEDEPRSAA